jgi:nitrogen fixation NifU-like protein
MSNFSSLIIDHFSNPRNMGELPLADLNAVVRSPVCGDQIHLFAQMQEDRIAECTFLAYGCAAAIGTASILTEAIQRRCIDELAMIDAAKIVQLVGGLSPSQRHCAQLGHDAIEALVHAYRNRFQIPEATRA